MIDFLKKILARVENRFRSNNYTTEQPYNYLTFTVQMLLLFRIK